MNCCVTSFELTCLFFKSILLANLTVLFIDFLACFQEDCACLWRVVLDFRLTHIHFINAQEEL